jgi:hypothetical protein
MCSSCKTKEAIARGLCKSCYNKDYWSRATPAQLQKRRNAVSANYQAKRDGTFTRKIQLNPTRSQRNAKQAEIQREKRAYLKSVSDSIKIQLGCTDCGYNESPIALDFDHVQGDKLHGVSQIVNRGWSLDNLLAEIDKCEVRCANCHRIVTRKRMEKLE